jgi:chemotaxis protein methyltransferase CheR
MQGEHNADLSPRLTQEEFQAIKEFLSQHTGIALADNKRYLVQSRLGRLLPEMEMSSFGELALSLSRGTLPAKFRIRLIEALTTHETCWFRDSAQFELLQNVLLPKLSRLGAIRIWSAACSTGQEPYSIGICLCEAKRLQALKLKAQILATDLARSALDLARQAVYSDLAVARGLSRELRERYFQRRSDGWQLNAEVTRLVSFQLLNLLHPFAALGKFDLIFCRNVLIYFAPEDRRQILKRMAEVLTPGGYLFLSSTESLPSGLDCLTPVLTLGVRYYTRLS